MKQKEGCYLICVVTLLIVTTLCFPGFLLVEQQSTNLFDGLLLT
jgi:hypothetical protein